MGLESHLPSERHGNRPILMVMIVTYLVFAVALAHTAYTSLQGYNTAKHSITASSQSLEAFSTLKQQLELLRKELADAQAGLSASTKQSSSQVQDQLEQLKQDLAKQVHQSLEGTSQAANMVLEQAKTVGQGLSELQQQVATVNNKLAGAQAPAEAAPAGARVEDKELHHIATHGAVCDKKGAAGLTLNLTNELVAPLVVVGYNRPGYLAKTMTTLLKYWSENPSYAAKFPLFISIDGDDQRTLLLASAMHLAYGVQVITRSRVGAPQCHADCHIAQHYKILLQLFLDCLKAPGLLFLEEDLEVAPDFFSYFEATVPLMTQDSSIFCVSAWNDHGQEGRAKDSTALYRTDVMPGLGWYLNAAIGRELAAKWPMTNWDDWMRLPTIRLGRSCIFPEVSRTHTFGRIGTHGGEGFDNHHSNMVLNREPIDWRKLDLSYLLKDNYAALMRSWLAAAQPFEGSVEELGQYCAVGQPDDTEEHPQDLVVRYPRNPKAYTATAIHLKPMMSDVREGSPRGSYEGHVVVRCRGRRLFIMAA